MLKSVKCNNFKSFQSETSFSLVPENYDYLLENVDNNLLNGLLFVGGNASGKTNSIKIIEFFIELVFLDDINIKNYTNFYNNDNMSIEYEFNLDLNYHYSIIYHQDTGDIEEIFLVNNKEILNKKNKEIEIKNKIKEYPELYNFISNSFIIDLYSTKLNISKLSRYNPDVTYTEKTIMDINNFLIENNFEFTITTKTKNAKTTDIYFKRQGSEINFPFEMESIGNRNLIYILPMFIKIIEDGGMLILDEFGSCFHNQLEQLLIRQFMVKSEKAQIFMVSHSTNLLSNNIFRPDQIYTIDFHNYQTIINRVSDENPRMTQNLEKMYLGGVFGGLPNFNKK